MAPLVVVALATAACASGAGAPAADPTSSSAAAPVAPPVGTTAPRPTLATTTIPTRPPTTTTATAPTTAPSTTIAAAPTTEVPDPGLLAGISMTSVPADVIVPTTKASMDASNPINGGRGGSHPLPDDVACADGTPACLTGTLDTLGLDVGGGSPADRARRLQRATAVVQLDAGVEATGQPDAALLDYLRPTDPQAAETRQIGTSAQGRPITAVRYGSGPRVVLVVGQTHGDEEGGRRVLLRARSRPLPAGVTLWVVPTMNPDGSALDTRFLADGADPNRKAPTELEQKAVYDFALAVRPVLTVWYHQNYGWVGGSGASMTPARRYQSLTKLGTLKHSGDCAVGFEWCPIDDAIGSSSILVELPDVLTPADVQRHADALLAVASDPGA